MANYVASGWKHDLTHFIGCCWVAQIGSLEWDKWHVAIAKFIAVMAKWKASEWTDIKELTPLQFMPYIDRLFKEVTGQDLQGLSDFTGWIGQGGYYHWRVVQQGLIHLAPTSPGSQGLGHLMPTLVVSLFHRSWLRLRLRLLDPLGNDWTGPNQPLVGTVRDPPQTRVDSRPPPAKVERLLSPGRAESHPLPTRAVNRPPQVEVGHQQPREVPPTFPQVGEEQVMVNEPTGMRCTCARPRVESLSLQGLPIPIY